VENRYSFAPPRRIGLLFHIGVILFLSGAIGGSIWQLFQIEIGPRFFIELIFTLVGVGVLAILLYRAYALWGAYYSLERDGICLHWGLRIEDIPMKTVRWVYPYRDLKRQSGQTVPFPWLRLPGSILGVRHFSNDMAVEFLASNAAQLVLIATQSRIFAISPADPQNFLAVYQHFNELGSITPIEARSVYPSRLFSVVWQDRPARYLLLVGILFNLFLLGWVSLIIPTRSEISLGIFADESLPPVRLLLLPFLSSFFFLIDLALGFFFYRRDPSRRDSPDPNSRKRRWFLLVSGKVLAFTLWGGSLITSLLFLGSIYFILLIE
jgi:hypothetical protein